MNLRQLQEPTAPLHHATAPAGLRRGLVDTIFGQHFSVDLMQWLPREPPR